MPAVGRRRDRERKQTRPESKPHKARKKRKASSRKGYAPRKWDKRLQAGQRTIQEYVEKED